MLQNLNASFENLMSKLLGWVDALIVSLPNAILALTVMALAIWMSRMAKNGIRNLMRRVSNDESVNRLAASAGSIFIVLFALFVSLGILNLDKALTSLLTTAGIAGLAVGMALQEPLMNTFSGIMMSMRKFYNIGDWIQTNGYEGQIQNINLRWTELQRPSGEKIILPNKMIVSNPLENFSIAGRRRVELNCGVGYESNLDNVEYIAKRAISREFDFVKDHTGVEFYYTEFADSSINFVIRFWMNTRSLVEYKAAKSKAIVVLKKAFDRGKINIPFPIRTLDFSLTEGKISHEINENNQKSSTKSKPPHEASQNQNVIRMSQ